MKAELEKMAWAMGHVALGFAVGIVFIPLSLVIKFLDDRYDITCP
jgi:hypothetical protein